MKRIRTPVLLLGLVSLFTDIASEMLYPVTPLFLTAGLGASMAAVGLIEGLAEVVAGFLKGYFGALSDRLGRRAPFVVAGYGLSAFTKSLPGIIPALPTVLFSRVVDRIGKGIRTAPRDALLAGYAKENNTGAVFGFHRAMDTTGAAIGPVVALVVLYLHPGEYVLMFLLAFAPSLVAFFLTLRVKDIPREEKEKKDRPSNREFVRIAPPRYRLLLLLFGLFSLVNSSDVFLILKSKDLTHTDPMAISGYIFYNIIYAAVSYPVGRLADRIGKKRVFLAGLLLFSLVYYGFVVLKGIYIIFPLFLLYGLYAASTEGVSRAWVSDLIEDRYRGTAIGLFNTVSSLAMMVGSIGTGFLWDRFGSAIPFLITATVTLLVALALVFLMKPAEASGRREISND